MERIDLNMPIPHFCADYVHYSVRTRVEKILYQNARMGSIREVCETWESDLFKLSNWGKKSHIALKEALNECGLHLSMSDKELADYERYWLAEKARDIYSDTIDWEQRRWELASGIFLHYSDLTNKACIEMADAFIEEYKKSLNTEE